MSREEESYLKAQLFVSHFALHVYKAGAFLMREVTKRVNTLVMFEGEIREKEEEKKKMEEKKKHEEEEEGGKRRRRRGRRKEEK